VVGPRESEFFELMLLSVGFFLKRFLKFETYWSGCSESRVVGEV
jgi:hypothetical protein